MKIHTDKYVQKQNYISTLKRSQQYARAKEYFENLNKSLFEAPEVVKHGPQHIHRDPVPFFQVNFLLLLPAPILTPASICPASNTLLLRHSCPYGE